MSELNKKPNENITENTLIDEFLKMGINIETRENKINYSNSNSNKKDLAFNYYFGNVPLNPPNFQTNQNFVHPNLSQMENFYRINSNTYKEEVTNKDGFDTFKGIDSKKDDFNYSSDEYSKLNSNDLVHNSNIQQVKINAPQQNMIYKNNHSYQTNLGNNILKKENNIKNQNANFNPNVISQNPYTFDNYLHINNKSLAEQNAFLNQTQKNDKNDNLNNNNLYKNLDNAFFQHNNPLINNGFKANNLDYSSCEVLFNNKNVNNRNINFDSKKMFNNKISNRQQFLNNGFSNQYGNNNSIMFNNNNQIHNSINFNNNYDGKSFYNLQLNYYNLQKENNNFSNNFNNNNQNFYCKNNKNKIIPKQIYYGIDSLAHYNYKSENQILGNENYNKNINNQEFFNSKFLSFYFK